VSANAVKTMTLRLPGLIGCWHLCGDHVAQRQQLGIAAGIYLRAAARNRWPGGCGLRSGPAPADQVHIAQQHLDLAADQQALKGRVVDVHVGNVDSSIVSSRCASMRRAWLHILELALHGQAKDDTALSMRLSTFTRSRWIRLSSRSTWRKKLSPPRIWVLYFSS
jgi:hypothetical protein